MPPKTRNWPIQKIRRWIEIDLLTQRQVGEKLGCLGAQISKLCRRHQIQTQRRGPRGGPAHPDWKGGVHVDRQGYVFVYAPWHPRKKKYGNYVLLSRLLMEQKIGRLLRREEVVHHINDDRGDNRIENLQLFSTNADHLRETLKGKRPKWTPAGRRRTLEGLERWRKNQKKKASGGHQPRQATVR